MAEQEKIRFNLFIKFVNYLDKFYKFIPSNFITSRMNPDMIGSKNKKYICDLLDKWAEFFTSISEDDVSEYSIQEQFNDWFSELPESPEDYFTSFINSLDNK